MRTLIGAGFSRTDELEAVPVEPEFARIRALLVENERSSIAIREARTGLNTGSHKGAKFGL